ncbi:MAG: YitT family protein [Bacilli bacterium]|nr:YitT family protein [Bacilli bacterium]
MKRLKNKSIRKMFEYLILTLGTLLSAFALEQFLIPNTILDGGVTGISIIIYKLTNIPLSILILIINVPFILLGYMNLGKRFLIRTIYSILCFSFFLTFFELLDPFTEEMLLATVFGGAILGIGTGLIIKSGGCTDGTESVAIIISKKTSLSVGQIVLAFNLIIYGIAGFIFGFDRAMYSLLTYVITFKVIDFVYEGLEQAKAAMIITDKGSNISEEIYKRLGRTTTKIKAKGLISGEKEVMYCVLTRIEIFELRHIVEDMDESAFVTITDVSDIIGDHIKSTNKRKLFRK